MSSRGCEQPQIGLSCASASAGKNCLKAHRSQLYQRLVISGKSHLEIALLYGGLAMIGGCLAWAVASRIPFAIPAAGAGVAGMFCGLWRWTLAVERRAAIRN